MAATAAPYGLRAVNHLGGTPYAGSTRMYPIASGLAQNIFYGDVVGVVTAGTIQQTRTTGAAGGTAFLAGTVGVFVGCTYTDPNLGTVVFRQYFPTGTVATDIQAYVIDDPAVIFQAQADASVTQAGLGACTFFAAAQSSTTGNTTTGNSQSALDATVTVNQDAFKIVGFVDSPTSTVGDAFTDLLVKFNPVAHAYTSGVGI